MATTMDDQFPFHIIWNDDTETKLLSFRDHLTKIVRCTHEGHKDGTLYLPLGAIHACWECWTAPLYVEVVQ